MYLQFKVKKEQKAKADVRDCRTECLSSTLVTEVSVVRRLVKFKCCIETFVSKKIRHSYQYLHAVITGIQ